MVHFNSLCTRGFPKGCVARLPATRRRSTVNTPVKPDKVQVDELESKQKVPPKKRKQKPKEKKTGKTEKKARKEDLNIKLPDDAKTTETSVDNI